MKRRIEAGEGGRRGIAFYGDRLDLDDTEDDNHDHKCPMTTSKHGKRHPLALMMTIRITVLLGDTKDPILLCPMIQMVMV